MDRTKLAQLTAGSFSMGDLAAFSWMVIWLILGSISGHSGGSNSEPFVHWLAAEAGLAITTSRDLKSTRLNSSHQIISDAVVFLEKKKHAIFSILGPCPPSRA